MVTNPPAMRETWVQSLGWEDPLEEAWQPTPVFLPGESPWTEKLGGLQSMRSQSWTLGFSYSVACGTFLVQGSNLGPLRWQADF